MLDAIRPAQAAPAARAPVRTAQPTDPIERIADVLLTIEFCEARAFRVAGMADLTGPFVAVRFPGYMRRLSPSEAVDVARCLRDDPPFRQAHVLADSFLSAAVEAQELHRLFVPGPEAPEERAFDARDPSEPGSPAPRGLVAWGLTLTLIAVAACVFSLVMRAG